MVRLWNLIALFLLPSFIFAFSPGDARAYIERYKHIALEHQKKYGIPATITLAQGLIESNAGNSRLTRSSNNHFGIKDGSSWRGSVHKSYDDEKYANGSPKKSSFRCYRSAEESFDDHSRLLMTRHYRRLFNHNVYDYRSWAFELKRAGYATAPDYAQALIGIIDRYRLYEINGGAKLRPGKKVVITRYEEVEREVEKPVFNPECVLAEDEESEEEAMVVAVRFVVMINDVRCTTLQPGENLSSIARKYDISTEKLLQFNEVVSETQFKAGDIVFLAKKKKKYEDAQDEYTVKPGDTLHKISQEFGIQLHELAKLNKIYEYAMLKEGMHISLK